MLTIQTNKPVVFQGQSLQPYCRYLFPPRTVADLYPALLADGAAHKAPGSFNSYERRYSSCMDAKRVLLYRHYAIGDQLICTGLVQYLNDTFPNIHIDVCTHARVADLWEGHDVGLYMAPLTFEAARGYDAHILLEGMLESNNEEDQNNCYDDMFAWCGIDPETVDARYKRPHIYPQKADKYHDEIMDPYILIHWSAGNVTRTYPDHRVMELIEILRNAFKMEIIVVGRDEEPLGHVSYSFHVHDLRNKTPKFRNLLPLIQQASLVICPDSSVMHAAAAFGTPTISLWGPIGPSDRSLYYSNDHPIFKKDVCPHAPCHFHELHLPEHWCKDAEPRSKGYCSVLAAIEPEEIVEKAKEVLG